MSVYAGSLKQDDESVVEVDRIRPATSLLVLLGLFAAADGLVFVAAPSLSPDWMDPAAITLSIAAAVAMVSALLRALQVNDEPTKRDAVAAAIVAAAFVTAGFVATRTDGITLTFPIHGATLVAGGALLAGALWALLVRAHGFRAAMGTVRITDVLLPAGVLTFASALIAVHAAPIQAGAGAWFLHIGLVLGAGITLAASWFRLAAEPESPNLWGASAGATSHALGAGLWLFGWSSNRSEYVIAALFILAIGFLAQSVGGIMETIQPASDYRLGDLRAALPRTVVMHWMPMLLVTIALMTVVAMRELRIPTTVLPVVVMLTALTYAIRLIASLVTHEFALNEALRKQMALLRRANIDALTELPNRAALDQRLDEEYERARRFSQPFAICFIDVDHFKQVNDTYGHDRGDVVLRTVAQALRQTARTIDIVGRYGGEEFLVLAPGTRAQDALILAERLRTAVESVTESGDFGSVPVTISVGVAGYPDNALTLEDVLRDADLALYDAKRSGRNRVRVTDRTPADSR